ncbi:hypothetical protein CLONEX_02962 [[Clostridium] nexile DSM 1787]|nr:hypothetical protein CLONEX_02962 [[Clostridium] nexile DSM 1787]
MHLFIVLVMCFVYEETVKNTSVMFCEKMLIITAILVCILT